MQTQESIVISNLTIGYKDKVVARHLNASVRRGELTCLLGNNGTGKSTLLRTLTGLQEPLGGEVWLSADGIHPTPLSALSRQMLARTVSVVLTEQPDVKQLTVEEIVGMGRMPYTGFFGTLDKEDKHIVEQALCDTGLQAFAHRYFDSLSDGERQKVMIAKALAQQTPAIILDEPTAFLDYPSKVEMMKFLHRLATDNDKTILLSTHDLELALHHADRLLTMGKELRYIEKDSLQQYLQTTE